MIESDFHSPDGSPIANPNEDILQALEGTNYHRPCPRCGSLSTWFGQGQSWSECCWVCCNCRLLFESTPIITGLEDIEIEFQIPDYAAMAAEIVKKTLEGYKNDAPRSDGKKEEMACV